MEEVRRLPRNIRQMGEKEEDMRVYLEDFVYTFIRKLDAEKEARAGILLGNRETVEGKRCFFISGAVELEGLIGENGICFSEETWKTVEEEIAAYFSDCSICGWFVCGVDETFPDHEMLKKVHMQVFSGENCLMYWREEENDCFWLEEEKKLNRLLGYYVYYERNFQMQNYMLSCTERPVSELVDDQAAQNFRKIMKTKQHRRRSSYQIWTQAGTVAAVAIIFVGSIYLIGRLTSTDSDEDQIPAFAVGASVERQGNEEETSEKQAEVESTDVEERQIETISEESEEDDNKITKEAELPTLKFYMNEPSTAEKESDAISAGVSVKGQKYTIQPGDTLADISIRFYGSTGMIMDICEYNGITNPNTIFIGQEIELP